jgi:uncharacterized membrane protein
MLNAVQAAQMLYSNIVINGLSFEVCLLYEALMRLLLAMVALIAYFYNCISELLILR